MLKALSLCLLIVLAAATGGESMAEEEITPSFVTANGLEFGYYEAGQGPLALLLHGYPETARSWRKVQASLAQDGYRAVAVAMRGYPPTEIPGDGDYTVASLGKDVLALIDALGAESAILVGHDWGAGAAYAAATAAPEKVDALVAIAIPHAEGIGNDPKVLLEAPHFLYYQLPFIKYWVSRNDFSHLDRIYADWSPPFEQSDTALAHVKQAFGKPGRLEAALGYYRDFLREGEAARGPARPGSSITVPSLVIAGVEDGAVNLDRFDKARTAFTGPYQLVALEGVGHFPQLEAPGRVADAIRRFLNP